MFLEIISFFFLLHHHSWGVQILLGAHRQRMAGPRKLALLAGTETAAGTEFDLTSCKPKNKQQHYIFH